MRVVAGGWPIIVVLACSWSTSSNAFQILQRPSQRRHTGPSRGYQPIQPQDTSSPSIVTTSLSASRPRSVVHDPDGPTPVLEQPPVPDVDPNDIEGLAEVMDPDDFPHPIPHQPWRRGDTAGCEAPITVDWRQQAEAVIEKAVLVAGAKVLDITWFLTSVVVTLDDEVGLPKPDLLKDKGPVVNIVDPAPPVYYDPADPDPDEIWDDEDDVLYERETEDEAADKRNRQEKMWATVGPDDPKDEPHIPNLTGAEDISLYRNLETREDVAGLVMEEMQERHAENQQPIDIDTILIDTSALSSISYAILQALEMHEDEWRILARHELILSSPNPAKDVLETQRQFDAHRDHFVAVYTQDPFESNRTLKGQLVDRNAMDLILNIQGNMVTVPHNFIKCVRTPPNSAPYDLNFEERNDDGDVVEFEAEDE